GPVRSGGRAGAAAAPVRTRLAVLGPPGALLFRPPGADPPGGRRRGRPVHGRGRSPDDPSRRGPRRVPGPAGAPASRGPGGCARLARSFVARPALIRRVAAGEVVLFTDGEGALTIRPDEGLAEYQAPPAPPPAAGQEAAPAPGPAEALAAAVAFGAEHGGWPGEGDVVLTGVSPIVARGSLSDPQILGYRFQFMQRIDGYLLADRHLAVIEVDARGVVHWRRRFIEDRLADPEGTVAIEIESAAEAVAR